MEAPSYNRRRDIHLPAAPYDSTSFETTLTYSHADPVEPFTDDDKQPFGDLPEDGNVDLIAIERAARGDDTVLLTPREVIQLARYMMAAGYSITNVGMRLGMAVRDYVPLVRCACDPRCRELLAGNYACEGGCPRRHAVWVVVHPEGSAPKLCSAHAAAALDALDTLAALDVAAVDEPAAVLAVA